MKKEQWSKDQSDKDHLHPKDRVDWIDAADHDELTHIPGGEGKDKTCKELVSQIPWLDREDDETKGKVHRKGNCRRKRQDVHRSTVRINAMRSG